MIELEPGPLWKLWTCPRATTIKSQAFSFPLVLYLKNVSPHAILNLSNWSYSLHHFFVFLVLIHLCLGASLVAQTVKTLPAMQETWVRSLGQEDPLEKEMATHSTPGMQDPSSPSRDWTCAPGNGNTISTTAPPGKSPKAMSLFPFWPPTVFASSQQWQNLKYSSHLWYTKCTPYFYCMALISRPRTWYMQ